MNREPTELRIGTGVSLEQAGAALDKVVATTLRRMPAAEATLAAWPLVCGSAVAERTRALHFAAGVLRVEVADAGWRRELQALAPRYVAAINRYTAESVERIEFEVASHANPGQRLPRAEPVRERHRR